jgi:hypothetical protein
LFTSREGNARNGAELRRIHAFFGNDQQLEFGRRRPELPSILAAGVFEIVGVE